MTFLFVGVLQVGLALHVRNTLVDAAGEGARYGAVEGRGPTAAEERTRQLITSALTGAYAESVAADTVDTAAGPVLVVRVRAPLPLVGLAGPRAVDVSGRALVEGA